MQDYQLLDCTFRDGGYHNNWSFPLKVVQNQVEVLGKLGVQYIELGFRFRSPSDHFGENATTNPDYLATIAKPEQIKFAVMSNGADLIREVEECGSLKRLYPGRELDSQVDLVRLAIHLQEADKAVDIAKMLASDGYRVAINLMQITQRTKYEVADFLTLFGGPEVDYLYFADSLGALTKEKTKEIAEQFKLETDKPFGIHAHDNQGTALANSIVAVENGATFVDGSITGMGRGPGNTILEELLISRDSERASGDAFDALLMLIDEYYHPLKQEKNWGKSLMYYLAAKHNIHPTFIQELDTLKDLSMKDQMDAIRQIAKHESPSSYSKQHYWHALSPSPSKTPVEIDKFIGKNILLIGPSQNLKDSQNELQYFIKNNAAIVIALNTHDVELEDEVDFRIISSPLRSGKLSEIDVGVIMPFASGREEDVCFPIQFGDSYGLEDNRIRMRRDLVLPYAIGFLKFGGVNSLTLCGFDGPVSSDAEEIESAIREILSEGEAKPIFSLFNSRFSFCTQIPYYSRMEE